MGVWSISFSPVNRAGRRHRGGKNARGLSGAACPGDSRRQDQHVVSLGTVTTNTQAATTQIGGLGAGVVQLSSSVGQGVVALGSYSAAIAEISPAIQALANQIVGNVKPITQEMIDKAREQADEYGQLTLGTDAVINALVKLTAENGKFCEAISDLGLAQENTLGIFKQSYIGPTSGYDQFKALDAAIAKAAGTLNGASANLQEGGDYVQQSLTDGADYHKQSDTSGADYHYNSDVFGGNSLAASCQSGGNTIDRSCLSGSVRLDSSALHIQTGGQIGGAAMATGGQVGGSAVSTSGEGFKANIRLE